MWSLRQMTTYLTEDERMEDVYIGFVGHELAAPMGHWQFANSPPTTGRSCALMAAPRLLSYIFL